MGLSFLLVSCAGTGPSRFRTGAYDYRNIPPVWVVRNAPVPVPRPVMRPSVPRAVAAAPPRRAAAPAPAPTASPSSASATRVEVRRGDTVYAISRRTGVHVRTIIARNNLKPPYLLRPGDTLVVPSAPVHEVKRGETSYSISRAYSVDLAELMQMNGIDRPYTLYPG
ncbi:MAG: LysM domain-containing protein, partial [Sphingomonadales bacterium]